MKESKFTKSFIDELKKCNCHCIAFVASAMQEGGIPDRWVSGQGLPQCWLEFKAPNGSLREDQRKKFERFDEHGADALIIREIPGGFWIEMLDRVVMECEWPKEPPRGPKLRAMLIEGLKRRRECLDKTR